MTAGDIKELYRRVRVLESKAEHGDQRSMMFCAHANEAPSPIWDCSCSSVCGCRTYYNGPCRMENPSARPKSDIELRLEALEGKI